jgi:EXLDI family protein
MTLVVAVGLCISTFESMRIPSNADIYLTNYMRISILTLMANKTIYVSQKDEAVFEEAQQIAGEALSAVIARALREFVARSKERETRMSQIKIKVGPRGSEREQRFIGSKVGNWKGFSDDKEWFQVAHVFHTQKDNWAVLLTTVCPAARLTDKKAWRKSAASIESFVSSELIVAPKPEELSGRVSADLVKVVQSLAAREANAVEVLDI